MNIFRFSVFLLLSSMILTTASASRYQTVTISESGMVATYWKVPAQFQCHIKIPDEPMAFCKGPGNVIYHVGAMPIINYAVNPDQYVNNLLQKLTSQGNISIINRYTIPEITQHLWQLDQQIIFRKGQQTYLYAVEAKGHDDNEIGTSLFVVNLIPNNGSPITAIDLFGISMPAGQQRDFKKLRSQLTEFMLSKRYDNNYVQAINAQHLSFLANLNARQRNFDRSQQIIHQNNMDALDRSYDSYKRRSATSDSMQQKEIDSIYERRQMVNPNTGQRYQVEGYHDYNYVNPNDPDMYIQTDDPSYNPNLNMNQGENYDLLEEN